MKPFADKKILFFGCPLDADEKYDAIREKHQQVKTSGGFDDPLDGVLDCLAAEAPAEMMNVLGSLPVPAWLGPRPGQEDRSNLTTENMISFIDGNGCREVADAAGRFAGERVLPDIPCMIGIDHSLTGGVFSALAGHYGTGNLSLVILDSPTDAIPMSVLAGAVQYDAESNPSSVHDSDDPYLYNRPDSYNASSFVHTLLKDKVVAPKNLYILGVSDYPDKKSFRIKDGRIKKYANAYLGLKRKGVTLLTKKECRLNPGKINNIIKKIATPYVYISIDMDIGANNALEGVRFRNQTGLCETDIYKIADALARSVSGSTQLAGIDICEIDPRRAGVMSSRGKDRTYDIAATLIKKIVFNN